MQNVMYIPGLGEENSIATQAKLMNRAVHGKAKVSVFNPKWHTAETYEDKYQRLQEFAKDILISSEKLIVVGVSAGGPLAVRFSHENSAVNRAYYVAGKLKGSEKIGPNYQKRAPALLDCVKVSENLIINNSVLAAKSVILRPIFDNVVPISDMVIVGAIHVRLPMIMHTPGILYALLIYFPYIFAKMKYNNTK